MMAGIIRTGVNALSSISNLGYKMADAASTMDRWRNLLAETFRNKDVKVARVGCDKPGKLKLRLEGVRIVDVSKLEKLINTADGSLVEEYAKLLQGEREAIESRAGIAVSGGESGDQDGSASVSDQHDLKGSHEDRSQAVEEAEEISDHPRQEDDERLLWQDVDVKRYKEAVLSPESYVVEIEVDEGLTLGELDYGELATLAEQFVVKDSSGRVLEQSEELKNPIIETLQLYCKFSVDSRLAPDQVVKDALSVKNDTWLIGGLSNLFRSRVLGQVVEQQFDLVAKERPENLRDEAYRQSLVRLAVERNNSKLLRRFAEVEQHSVRCEILGLQCKQKELEAEIAAREAELKEYWRKFIKWAALIILAMVLVTILRATWIFISGMFNSALAALRSIGFIGRIIEWAGSLVVKGGTYLAAYHFGMPVLVASFFRRAATWIVRMLSNPYFWAVGGTLFAFGAKTTRDFKRARLAQCRELHEKITENLKELEQEKKEGELRLELFDKVEEVLSEQSEARTLVLSGYKLLGVQADEVFRRIPYGCYEAKFVDCGLRSQQFISLLASVTNPVYNRLSTLDPVNHKMLAKLDLSNNDLLPSLVVEDIDNFRQWWQRAAELLKVNCCLTEVVFDYTMYGQLPNSEPPAMGIVGKASSELAWIRSLSEPQQAAVIPFYQQLVLNRLIAGQPVGQSLLDLVFKSTDGEPVNVMALATAKVRGNFWLHSISTADGSPIEHQNTEMRDCFESVVRRNKVLFKLCSGFEHGVPMDGSELFEQYQTSGTTSEDLGRYLKQLSRQQLVRVKEHINQYLIEGQGLLTFCNDQQESGVCSREILDICCQTMDGVTDMPSLRNYLIVWTLEHDKVSIEKLSEWPSSLRSELVSRWIGRDISGWIRKRGVGTFVATMSKVESEQRIETLTAALRDNCSRLTEFGVEARGMATCFEYLIGRVAAQDPQSEYLTQLLEEYLTVKQQRKWWMPILKDDKMLDGFEFTVLYYRLRQHVPQIEGLEDMLVNGGFRPRVTGVSDWRVEFEQLFAAQILAELAENPDKYKDYQLTEVVASLSSMRDMTVYNDSKVAKLHKSLEILGYERLSATMAATAKQCKLNSVPGLNDNVTDWIKEHTAGEFLTVLSSVAVGQQNIIIGRELIGITDWRVEFERVLAVKTFELLMSDPERYRDVAYAPLIQALVDVRDMTVYDADRVTALHTVLNNTDVLERKILHNLIASTARDCELTPVDGLRGNVPEWMQAHGADELVVALRSFNNEEKCRAVVSEVLENYCKHLTSYGVDYDQLAGCLTYVARHLDLATDESYFVGLLTDSLGVRQKDQFILTKLIRGGEFLILGGFKPMVLYYRLRNHRSELPGLDTQLQEGGFYPKLVGVTDWRVEFERVLSAQILAKLEDRVSSDSCNKLMTKIYDLCNSAPSSHSVGAVSRLYGQIIDVLGKEEFSALVANSIGECSLPIDIEELKQYLTNNLLEGANCLLDFSAFDAVIPFKNVQNEVAHGTLLTFVAASELAAQLNPSCTLEPRQMLSNFKQLSFTQAVLAVNTVRGWGNLTWNKENMLGWVNSPRNSGSKGFFDLLCELNVPQRVALLSKYFIDFAGRKGTAQDKALNARKKAVLLAWLLDRSLPESVRLVVESELKVSGSSLTGRKAGNNFAELCEKLRAYEDVVPGLSDNIQKVTAEKVEVSIDLSVHDVPENHDRISDRAAMDYIVDPESAQSKFGALATRASKEQIQQRLAARRKVESEGESMQLDSKL